MTFPNTRPPAPSTRPPVRGRPAGAALFLCGCCLLCAYLVVARFSPPRVGDGPPYPVRELARPAGAPFSTPRTRPDILAAYEVRTSEAGHRLQRRRDRRRIRQALRLHPGSAALHRSLADLLGDESALHEYQEVVRLEPHVPAWRCALAQALADRGRLADAAQQYREALRIEPASGRDRYLLAWTLHRMGQESQALSQWRTVTILAEPSGERDGASRENDLYWARRAEFQLQRGQAIDAAQSPAHRLEGRRPAPLGPPGAVSRETPS